MNDPNKAIDVNLSSLLSLKAELLRKQAEVSKAKATRPDFVASRMKASNNKPEESINSCKTSKNDMQAELKVEEHEDSALLEKSQRILQAKSKYYDKMSRSGGQLNSDDHCLVMFNRKQQEEGHNGARLPVSSDEHSSDSERDESDDDEEDWVEYTDCLGRTRKCLRKDLASAQQRDRDLAASMPERIDQSKANWMIDAKGSHDNDDDSNDMPIGPLPPASVCNDDSSVMSKMDEQRANWERKELENVDKPDVHYQDVFFDEARQHGVGYYAFSTDEDERKRQQKELEDIRKHTLLEQQQREAMRSKREQILKERVLAAKNRQRARLGLPPLEQLQPNSEEQADNQANDNESKEERRARKKAAKLQRKLDKLERQRETERQQHIRPWDESKEGMQPKSSSSEEHAEWQYKPDREPLSQAEWNEKQRQQRKAEFAPVAEESPTLKRKNFTSVAPPAYNAMMPPPSIPNEAEFSMYQSSKRERKFQRRSYDNEQSSSSNKKSKADDGSGGVCIAPPSDLDNSYRIPAAHKKSKTQAQLESSIEAGLRFLRDNSDKGNLSTKSSWTAKADY